jgi:hypothetical protein
MNSRRAARSSVVNERIDAKGRPVITLSIDLDMRWGARSQLGPVAHPIDAALLQIPELVHLMLVELDDFDLPTTWFVPAAVTCGSWDEYFATAPDDPRLLVNRQRITTESRQRPHRSPPLSPRRDRRTDRRRAPRTRYDRLLVAAGSPARSHRC